MKLKWHKDYELCDNDGCKKHLKCWRFMALVRLIEDKEEPNHRPRTYNGYECDHFIKDEYGKEEKK